MTSPPRTPSPPHAAGAASPPPGRARASSGPPVQQDIDTLKPPPWAGPRSVSTLALERLSEEGPVSRRTGNRAEAAHLRGRLAESRRVGDAADERAVSRDLARLLSRQGTELDTATHLARHALSGGEDPRLRAELSAWYGALGEPSLAAATLRPLLSKLVGARSARVLVRAAVLQGRAGEPSGAAASLRAAASADTRDPIPCELLGALYAWAPTVVPAREAAEAYLEASRRREERGDGAGAFEDLLRAFEAAPELPRAADRMSSALTERGRKTAADEVLREHARAWKQRSRAVHFRRYREALAEGGWPRALAAAFDASLDRAIVPEEVWRPGSDDGPPASFDDLLRRLGLADLRAARLQIAAQASEGALRARCLLTLAEIYRTETSRYPRAVDCWLSALRADPTCDEALASLDKYAEESGDYGVLADGLCLILEEDSAVTTCARRLLDIADDRLCDPALGLFAARRLREFGEPTGALTVEQRAERAELQSGALNNVRNRVTQTTGEEKAGWLAQLAASLRGRPELADECITALSELYDLNKDATVRVSLLRMLEYHGRWERLERFLQRDVRQAVDAEAALRLCRFYVARGRLKEALAAASDPTGEPLLERERCSLQLALAAQTGAERVRADAMLQLGSLSSKPVYAELACVASEGMWSAGDLDAAREAAEAACHAGPTQARPTLAYARASEGVHTRVSALALERAIGTVVPRALWCRRLADTLESLADVRGALTWTQRWLALRPGDLDAASALLRRAVANGEGAPLGDALAWLLTQAQPLAGIADELQVALARLAELDADRSTAIARRMLDVFGARVEPIRREVRRVARMHGERGLEIAVIERELAGGAVGEERRERLLELARLRSDGGDVDGAARTLVRALRERADADAVRQIASGLGEPKTTDGEVSRLAVAAELASRGEPGPPAASSWRRYGAALWDLAQDRPGAIEAWERAAAIDPEKGYEHLARDLVAFLGAHEAGRRLRVLADAKQDKKIAGRILVVAAAVAMAGGAPREALAFSIDALERDPTRADALALAEGAARNEDGESLVRAYELSLSGVMGKYGERSLYYRAARQFERRGDFPRGLAYAIQAFDTIPRPGVTYVLMMRLAQRVGETQGVVAAIDRAAARAAPEERATWLQATASLGGGGVSGERHKINVLLRGLATTPQPDIVRALGASMKALLAEDQSEREAQHIRFQKAVEHLLGRQLHDVGDETLADAALLSLDVFADAEFAYRILSALWRDEPTTTQFSRFIPHVAQLAAATAPRDRFLEQVRATVDGAGSRALEFASAVAGRSGQDRVAASFLVAAALAKGADDALIHRAEYAAQATGDPQLLRMMQAAMPLEQRLAVLSSEVERCERSGDFESAVRYLDLARDAEGAEVPELRVLQSRARDSLRAAHKYELLAKDLQSELIYIGEPARRLELLVQLSDALTQADQHDRALAALADALEIEPDQADLWRSALSVAEQAGDLAWQCECLGRLIELTPQAERQLEMLQRLAPLLASSGDEPGAVRRYNEWLRLQPDGAEAWEALEQFATRREDWQGLCELLGRRVRTTKDVATVRACQTRMARILEMRLGRPHAAREQLQLLVADDPRNISIITHLADLTERLGDPLHAAQLWARSLDLTPNRDLFSQYAARACAAFLAGGDVDAARAVLERDSTNQDSERICELRVEVARRSDDPPALGNALEQMARHSTAPPRERAALWVESARASLDAGSRSSALSRAQRSAQVAPHAAEPRLLVEMLEYEACGGPGDEQRAQRSVNALRGISEVLTADQHERYAFFLAEALDVLGKRDLALRELREARSLHGALPLIALGLAERLSDGDVSVEALELFSIALASNLEPLRQRGLVALSAAEAAHRAGEHHRALDFVQVAASFPEVAARADALRQSVQAALAPADPQATAQRDDVAPVASAVTDARATAATIQRSSPPVAPQRSALVTSPADADPAEEPIPLSTRKSDRPSETTGGAGQKPGALSPPPQDASSAARSSISIVPEPVLELTDADVASVRESAPAPRASNKPRPVLVFDGLQVGEGEGTRGSSPAPRPDSIHAALDASARSREPAGGGASAPPVPPRPRSTSSRATPPAELAASPPAGTESPSAATGTPADTATVRRESPSRGGTIAGMAPAGGAETETKPARRSGATMMGLSPQFVRRSEGGTITGVSPPRPFASPGAAAETSAPVPAPPPGGGAASKAPASIDDAVRGATLAVEQGAFRGAPAQPIITPKPDPNSVNTPVVEADVDPASLVPSVRPPSAPRTGVEAPKAASIAPIPVRGVGQLERKLTPPPGTTRGVGQDSLPPAMVSSPAVRPSIPPAARGVGSPSRSIPPQIPTLSASESGQFAALRERGDLAAADDLYRALRTQPKRAHELVGVCRQAWAVDPGNLVWLSRMRQAAETAKDPVYARALLHAERCLGRDGRLEAPPLERLRDSSSVRELLFLDQLDPGLTAIGTVWNQARQLFRRPLVRYGVNGRARISMDAPTDLSRAYSDIVRLLASGRTAIYTQPADAMTAVILMVDPPAVLLRGPDVPANLHYELAGAIALAQNEVALAAGLDDRSLDQLLAALQLAFGPPNVREGSALAALNLAERLWEIVPARSQRDLRTLCDTTQDVDVPTIRRQLRHLTRRAGLLATGDLSMALKRFFSEERIKASAYVGSGGTQRLCREHPVARDLVFLATSPEYAEARWRVVQDGPATGGPRR